MTMQDLSLITLIVTALFLMWLIATWKRPNTVGMAVVRMAVSALLFSLTWSSGQEFMSALWAFNVGINVVSIMLYLYRPGVALFWLTAGPLLAAAGLRYTQVSENDVSLFGWIPYAVYPQLVVVALLWIVVVVALLVTLKEQEHD